MRGWAVLTVLLAACTTAPQQRAEYSRYSDWMAASLFHAGRSVDAAGIRVGELTLDRDAGYLVLTVKACNTLRVRWQLVDDRGSESNLRVEEAVSSTGCADRDAVDEVLREVLRSANRVQFLIERIEIDGPAGRLALEPA